MSSISEDRLLGEVYVCIVPPFGSNGVWRVNRRTATGWVCGREKPTLDEALTDIGLPPKKLDLMDIL